MRLSLPASVGALAKLKLGFLEFGPFLQPSRLLKGCIAFEKEKITDEQNVLIKLVGRDSNKCVNKTVKCNNNNISNFSELVIMFSHG